MVKVYVSIDPKTGRALYRDEEEFLGAFESMFAAVQAIGQDFVRFCSFRAAQ